MTPRRMSSPTTSAPAAAQERLRPLPWFKWWYVDHRSHRVGRTLTCREEGMLLRLLEEQWLEGAIPDDYNRLAEIVGESAAAVADAWVKLQKFFRPVPGAEGALLFSRRLENERSEMDALRVKRSMAGKLGGRPRKQTKANESNASQAEMFHELPGGIRLPSHDLGDERKANESNGKHPAQESSSSSREEKSSRDAFPDPCICGGAGGLHTLECPIARLLRDAETGVGFRPTPAPSTP